VLLALLAALCALRTLPSRCVCARRECTAFSGTFLSRRKRSGRRAHDLDPCRGSQRHRAWNLDILDPGGRPFTVFAGTGAPRKDIRRDGHSSEGELVQSADDYTAAIRVRDTLGNAATAAETIPVDVLVLRDAERLRIIIASMTFPPYSADFTRVRKALVERGVREERMSATGVRASRPIVPLSDLENRWKDCRVEFILMKQ
jgi:hypothetical protein